MASPPYTISTSTPGDSDIVSQFPANERTNRDNINSWLQTNHDTNGNHFNIITPFVATPATPGASLGKIWMDTLGKVRFMLSDGLIQTLGVPPSTILFIGSGTVPAGYLLADGSAVSRATFADLFSQISTLYGPGNGSTTFNIPDLRGRVAAGEDLLVGRLSATYFGASSGFSPLLGNPGGREFHPLVLGEVPAGIISSGNNTIVVASDDAGVPRNAVPFSGQRTDGAANGIVGPGGGASAILVASITSRASNTINVTSTNTGGGNHQNVQPTLILRAVIKT